MDEDLYETIFIDYEALENSLMKGGLLYEKIKSSLHQNKVYQAFWYTLFKTKAIDASIFLQIYEDKLTKESQYIIYRLYINPEKGTKMKDSKSQIAKDLNCCITKVDNERTIAIHIICDNLVSNQLAFKM